jgi:hypothetical protein
MALYKEEAEVLKEEEGTDYSILELKEEGREGEGEDKGNIEL